LQAALKYAQELSKTPIILDQIVLDNLRMQFSEREIVAIAALTAKVNYWARLIEALRIKPAGYTDDPILNLEQYSTFKK
jgi:alkylhydroperoxidase family enzyme